MNRPFFSVIVLNYNGLRHNSRCLRSVLAQECDDFEVIFADNASTDGSYDEVRREFGPAPVRWVQNGSNLGYAGGNNAAARSASGRYLLFLNNDTELNAGTLQSLRAYLTRYPHLAGGQCALVRDSDRARLEAAGVDVDIFGFCYARSAGFSPEAVPFENIFTAIGAALVVESAFFARIGGFDESYFLLYEETDLCWRIWLAGGTLAYFPDALVYHVGSGTREPGPQQLEWFIGNRIRTLRKNLSAPLLPLSLAGNVLGMAALATLYAIKGRPRHRAAVTSALLGGLSDKRVAAKRRRVQSTRVVSDVQLLRRGLLRFPNPRLLLRNAAAYE